MKIAALDLGSNTFLCLIAEVENHQIKTIYSDEVEVVRLGQDLDKTKKFHPEALLRADECLKKMSFTIQKHKPQFILAMATAAARDAENKQALFDLGLKHNIPIEIIEGSAEAEITYKGALSGQIDILKKRLIIDIGGRSTEFICGEGLKLTSSQSYNMGCVKLTEKMISKHPVSEIEFLNLKNFIREQLQLAQQNIPVHFKIEEILAVAGTPTALAAAEIGQFDTDLIDGYILNESNLADWILRLQKATVPEIIQMGIPAGRADVILAGVIILLQTLETFNLKQIQVSTRGVRFGVALEVFNRNI